MLAADESEGGEGNEPASQARRELCRPLTGPSVSPVHPASLALTLCLIHMSCGEVRAAVLVVCGPAELREGCALGGERPVRFFPAANIPLGEEPALVPGPLLAQEADGGERRREEANPVGSIAGGLGSPPVPIPTCVRLSPLTLCHVMP